MRKFQNIKMTAFMMEKSVDDDNEDEDSQRNFKKN